MLILLIFYLAFLFKLLQGILPTRERLHRVGKVPSLFCNFCPGQVDNIEHLMLCMHSKEVTTALLDCINCLYSNTSPADITTLNIHPTESMELPVAWLVSTCLSYVWDECVSGKAVRPGTFRAELLAKAALLSSTKWRHYYTLHNNAVLLDELITFFL